jgi:hypothetical protein
VNWNQVVTGTPDAMSRKIKPSTVLDGLVTRLALFRMPSNDFAMIERRRVVQDQQRTALLRSIGLRLDQLRGCLECDRLVDYCYEYEARLAREAALEQDRCLDYFRKRIPLIMMRYTLVRMVCRELTAGTLQATTGIRLRVEDSDLEFAKLIGDWCLAAQMDFFGQAVVDALDNEGRDFVPRRRSQKMRQLYASLPDGSLRPEVIVSRGGANSVKTAQKLLQRWVQDGLVTFDLDSRTYKKVYKEIPV